ncbi:hypothetical protein D3C72_359280 [compost metagenome]
MDKNTFWYNTASARDNDVKTDANIRDIGSGIIRSMNVNSSHEEPQALNISAKSYIVIDVKNDKGQKQKSLVNSTESNKFNY